MDQQTHQASLKSIASGENPKRTIRAKASGMNESVALMTEADKLAAVADEVSASYATELGRVLRDLERQLRRLALDALDGSQTALARAVRAAKLRKQIQTALNESGYSRLAETATGRSLDAMVAQLNTLRGAAKLAQFTTSDLTRILALKELAKLDLLGQGQAIAHAIWRTFTYGLFSQRPINDLLDDLATRWMWSCTKRARCMTRR
jgi:hypothetical protein